MARPSKLTDKQWEEFKNRVGDGESLTKLSREHGISTAAASQQMKNRNAKKSTIKKSRKNTLEVVISSAFEMSLISRTHDKRYGLKNVKTYIKEFGMPLCRVDFAVFHQAKKITLVEVKGSYILRDIVAGIGQLHLYEAAFNKKWPDYSVSKVLLSACYDDQLEIVQIACENANIRFIRHEEG